MKRSKKTQESAWEQSRKLQRRKLITRTFLLLPIFLIVAILVVNNRDLISEETAAVEADRSIADSTLDTVMREASDSIPHESIASESGSSKKKTAEDTRETPVKEKRKTIAKTTQKHKNHHSATPSEKFRKESASFPEMDSPPRKPPPEAIEMESGEFSIEMPPFPCSIENRKDIVIALSLELFYTNSSFRDAILFRRNEIKVMVMRVIQKKVLPEMKIMILEKDLLKEINSIFDQPTISRVKIRNIQIEKVSTK